MGPVTARNGFLKRLGMIFLTRKELPKLDRSWGAGVSTFFQKDFQGD